MVQDQGMDADETYKMSLGEPFDFAQDSEQNDLVEFFKGRGSAGWLENKESADSAECDGDVSHKPLEGVAGGRVGSDEMERDEHDYDPDYELFFRSLKPCGNAYAVELKSRDFSVIIKYEDEDKDEFHVPKSTSARKSAGPPERNHSGRELENHLPDSGLADGSHWNDKRNPEDKKKKDEGLNDSRLSTRVPGELLLEDERCDGLQEAKSQREGCLGNMNPPRRRGRPRKVEKDVEKVQIPNQHKMDKVYVEFLSRLKFIGGVAVYTDEDGIECRYDESTPSSSGTMKMEPSKKRLEPSEEGGSPDEMNTEASAELPLPSDGKRQEPSNMNIVGSAKPHSCSGRNGLEPSNKRLRSSDERASSELVNMEHSVSEFRKKAMEIISMPYDPKECNDLLKQAKLKKPVMRHREMRGRSLSFPDEVEVAKSYLDLYEDLHKEIEVAQLSEQPHKVLHLLRGLFFYLKCLCMDGSFIPWKDNSWLEAVRNSASR